MKLFYRLLFVAILLLAVSDVGASAIWAEATPLAGIDTIAGAIVTIDIYFDYDESQNLENFTWPFVFYSPDGSITEVTHRAVPGGHWVYTSIEFIEPFSFYWNYGTLAHGASWEGSLPDTIGTVGIGGGMPPGLGAFHAIRFNFEINQNGTFCIDSSDHPSDAYDWLMYTNGSFVYIPFNGPYCWTVADVCYDSDGDGYGDPGYTQSCPEDNCPDVYNTDQADVDVDGVGDVCDNCPYANNPDQTDIDLDGIGDDCDECTDTDGDGFGDPGYASNTCPEDICPEMYNPDQLDSDGDGIGDVCDVCPYDAANDSDADGICADVDNCPVIYNPGQEDGDGDGIGDACLYCGDLDGNGVMNLMDIVYLIYFMYKDGPAPMCPGVPPQFLEK